MRTRTNKTKQIEAAKLQLGLALALGLLIKVGFIVFEISTVQASTVLKAIQ